MKNKATVEKLVSEIGVQGVVDLLMVILHEGRELNFPRARCQQVLAKCAHLSTSVPETQLQKRWTA